MKGKEEMGKMKERGRKSLKEKKGVNAVWRISNFTENLIG